MNRAFRVRGFVGLLLASAIAAPLGAQVSTLPPTPLPAGEPAPDGAVGEEIVITGVRGSLSSAQAIKRTSRQIVDSIVAEDIGKLPDNNVVEALQRVPGIQVSPRARGESTTVLIRGLPDVVTVINGRNIFSTTGRSLSLADVPADLVAGVDVYKSRSADQLEGGIAGLINIRTRRPFDFLGFRFAVAGRQVYSEQPGTIDPYASALISNRWDTPLGEIGVLASVSYHQTRYRDETIAGAGFFGYNLDNTRAPFTPGVPLDPRGTNPADPRVFKNDVIGALDTIGKRTRPAVNLALQWKPSDSLTLFADGLYYGFKDRGIGNRNFTSMNGTLLQPLTFLDDTKIVSALSETNARVANFGVGYDNTADRSQAAFGGKWEKGSWLLNTEVSYTKSVSTDVSRQIDVDFLASRIDATFNKDGSGASTFTVPNEDIADPTRYFLSRLASGRTKGKGEEYTWRGDASYRDPFWIFTDVSVGGRVNRRTAASDGFNQSVSCSPTAFLRCYSQRADSTPGLMTVTPGGFFKNVRDYPRQWATPNLDGMFDNIGRLREQFGVRASDPAFEDTRHFDIHENSYAGYGQASFEVGRLDGQLGARVIRTETTSNAFSVSRNSVTPVTLVNKTTDFLPNIALRYKITDNLFLRPAASRTITRPSFAQLNPAITLVPPIPGAQPSGSGAGGNANLKPVKSDNYDLGLEWYIDRSSSITATVFHRKIKGFIQSVTSNSFIDYLGADNGNYQISRPENSGSGKLTGVEGGFTLFPTFLPPLFDGFGVSANGTYIKGKNRALAPLPGVTGFLTIPFQDVSKYSASATLIYEQHGLSTRLSYVWRDKYNAGFHFTGINPNGITNGAVENLDLSISYDINSQFTVVFDATNITKSVFQTVFTDPNLFPRDTNLYTRTFAFGVRARF